MIQYETSEILVGNTNIAEAIETDEDILFSESYVVTGNTLRARKIHANYNLVIMGNVEADDIEINGYLVVIGCIKANNVRCQQLTCTGKTSISVLQCDENIMAKVVSSNNISVEGSMLVSDTIIIEEECDIEGNIIAGEGISGSGNLRAKNAIVGEYFDFDGEINSNVYEIETMFNNAMRQNEDTSRLNMDFDKQLGDLLDDFYNNISTAEEDVILKEIKKCANVQKVSFEEMYYIFYEIVRISYLNEISNLRDYLLIKYATMAFPSEFLEYETISHVFTKLISEVDESDLKYSADDILQFTMSLKIISTFLRSGIDEYADKIFSSIGLKYSFVKKQFERA